MNEKELYISYYINQNKTTSNPSNNVHNLFSQEQIPENQKNAIEQYIKSNNTETPAEIIATFTETVNKKNNSWPQLLAAVERCKTTGAKLIIAELGTLTNNESFSRILLKSAVSFHCCDQPFITPTILEALCKHSEIQRKKHGELIKEGLRLTSAKSGNPNAAKVISEVNKPKIDTAIIFAFLLAPIIADYRKLGYSQRQMVKTLNEEGFTAPEGGKWVLSQLQKVLDRVKLNELTLESEEIVTSMLEDNKTHTEIAERLNTQGIAALKKGIWNESQVKKLITRIKQLEEITHINRFIIDILPIMHEFSNREMNPAEIITTMSNHGIRINSKSNATEAA